MEILQTFEQAMNNNLPLSYALAFLGGLMDCLTPCSALATPVALSYFSSLNPGIPRRKVGVLTTAFALSVSLAYALMGLLAAWLGGIVFQWLGTSPWPYLVVGLFLLYLVAVSAEKVPLWLTPSFLRKTEIKTFGGRQGTVLGAMAVGLGVALMMGPCAAPVLTAILYVVASRQDLVFGVTLLLAFSLGISSFMVSVSLTGRRAVRYLGTIGQVRGKVGKVVNVLVFIIAGLILAKGVSNALTYGEPAGPDQPPAQTEAAQPLPPFYRFASASGQPLPQGGLVKGVALPDLGLTIQGNAASLAALHQDKWLFLTFWGTWCTQCVAEIPDILAMARDSAVKPRMVVLAVNVGEDEPVVAPFVRKNAMNYGQIIDPDGHIVEHLGVFSYPYNLLVAPDGRVAYASGAFPRNYRAIMEGYTPPAP